MLSLRPLHFSPTLLFLFFFLFSLTWLFLAQEGGLHFMLGFRTSACKKREKEDDGGDNKNNNVPSLSSAASAVKKSKSQKRERRELSSACCCWSWKKRKEEWNYLFSWAPSPTGKIQKGRNVYAPGHTGLFWYWAGALPLSSLQNAKGGKSASEWHIAVYFHR